MSRRKVGLSSPVRVPVIACALVVAYGCGSGPGSGSLEVLPPSPGHSAIANADPVYDGPPLELDSIPVGVAERGEQLYSIALLYEEAAEYRYELTNDIVTSVEVPEINQTVVVGSGLAATQIANVRQLDGGGAEILISTFDVESSVQGDEEIAEIIKIATASIEGSLMVGNYDKFGRSTDVYLKRGIGLSPIGPQAGDQDLTVGLMGLLLPRKPVLLGDDWSGQFDFTASVASFLSSVSGKAEDGEFPIVFTLERVNEEENYAVIGIRSEGRPTIVMGLVSSIETSSPMHVLMEGRALIDLDTGWLREMIVTTTVDYSGFLPGVKQTVLSVTRRIS